VLEPLPEPLDALAVRAHGTDFEGFAAGERRRFVLVAAVASAAWLAAALAAFATVRAALREARAAKQREDFVAAVTHELKAPLASIRLLAELLERGGVEEDKVREFGARTVAESDRLSRLVASILELARIERGEVNGAVRERIDLAELAREVVASFEPRARERGFAVEVRAAHADVLGSRDALHGALLELLDNALTHAREPHAIEIEVGASDRVARVAVLDRGPGVPEVERERIFEPFHRVGDELTRERPGVGLGLALVARVAQAHGGRAFCEARDGGGSRFVLELPLARAEVAA
jgi:signal transduction histidine kinase